MLYDAIGLLVYNLLRAESGIQLLEARDRRLFDHRGHGLILQLFHSWRDSRARLRARSVGVALKGLLEVLDFLLQLRESTNHGLLLLLDFLRLTLNRLRHLTHLILALPELSLELLVGDQVG